LVSADHSASRRSTGTEIATLERGAAAILELLFNFYRNEIEEAARHDRGYCDGVDVVVMARDLFWSSQKVFAE
jgi:hypothetical protein